MNRLLAILLLGFSLNAFAEVEVIASGLFKGKAMLTINGASKLLRQGETSSEGVKLVSSDSEKAVIEINGQRQTLKLTDRISGGFSEAETTIVRISRHQSGHYFVGGSINGRYTQFMVDTGATLVAMNSEMADNLGIDLRNAQTGMSSTAGGLVKSYVVTLPSITVGSITVPFVDIAVIEGKFPEQILLGNSFLSHVEMREDKGVLILETDH